MALIRALSGSSGGGVSDKYYFEEWVSSTTGETKTVTLEFDPLTLLDLSSSNYGNMWKRADTSSAWIQQGVNDTGYTNNYITNVNGRTVTLKNIHSGTSTYKFYAMAD